MEPGPITPPDAGASAPRSADDVYHDLRDHVSPPLALGARLMGRGAYEVEAEGAVVRLSDGRELLDFASYAVSLFGHRHPTIVAAVARQLGLMPSSTRIVGNPVQAAFASQLIDAIGAPYQYVWSGLSGADAVEAALKLARRASGRPRVLAVEGAFHGKSLGALGATHNPGFRVGIEAVVGHGVTHIAPDDAAAVARECAAGDVAAVLFEPIRGEAGVRPMDPELLRRWQADAHAAGAFFISDEIQVGFGRCGHLSVALADGLQPDAVLFAKPLGGGVMPLSAVVATPEFFAPLAKDGTFHSLTFGGHPLSCAAGLAALEVLRGSTAEIARLSTAFAARLPQIAAAHPRVFAGVRGRGLLWGLEFQTPALAGEMLLFLGEHGLIVCPCFSSKTVLRLFPPTTLTQAQLTQAFTAIERAAADCQAVLDAGAYDDAPTTPGAADPSRTTGAPA